MLGRNEENLLCSDNTLAANSKLVSGSIQRRIMLLCLFDSPVLKSEDLLPI
jgi:hypothetical protein